MKRVILAAALAVGIFSGLTAGNVSDVVVVAMRSEREIFETPYTTSSYSADKIFKRFQSRSLPEILREEPGVMVQKTAHGHGSPYIRGFTSFRTLLLVDGIRLNHSVFRPGPNQYWNTVDPLSLERLEIVKGPASVLYGSDAVGGTVNAITKKRESFSDQSQFKGRVYSRFSSAEDSQTVRGELSGNLNANTGFFTGWSYKDFGDLKAGDNTGRQDETGYDEWRDFDIKWQHRLASDLELTLAWQHVDQNDVPRTHKTIFSKSWHGTTNGDDFFRNFNQTRDLLYLQMASQRPTVWFDEAHVSVSHHIQDEERQRLKSSLRREDQGFTVRTHGLFAHFDKEHSSGQWSYGFDWYIDEVDSFYREYNPDGSLRQLRPRGPVADNARYANFGLYVQNEYYLSDQWELISGFRYTDIDVDADKVDEDPTDSTDFPRISERYYAYTGSLRLLHLIDERMNVFAGVSQGFRAPNLSDLTRLDDARSNEIQTQSTDLDPENFVAYEIGAKYQEDALSAELSCFHTQIQDFIMRTPTGQTIGSNQEVKSKNSGDGYVQGVEARTRWAWSEPWVLEGIGTWTEGEVDTFLGSGVDTKERRPLTRIMPLTGQLSLRWIEPEQQKFWLECVARFVGAQTRLSESDKSDTDRIPRSHGTPGHNVYSLRSGWQMDDRLHLSLALENITNKDYRVHGSGQNEPGRNLVLSIDAQF